MLDDDGTPSADRVNRDAALMRQQTNASEALSQFAVGMFGYEFVPGMPPPKINARTLKKFASDFAKKLD